MSESSFWTIELRDLLSLAILIATIIAIWRGPIRAVEIARDQEDRAQKERQKAGVFASLMKTRRFQLDPEHVAALNQIQVYFHGDGKVLPAYRQYIELLYERADEGQAMISLFKKRDDAFIELVSAIASSLKYNTDKREIERLAYSPEGWANDEAAQRHLRALFIDLLENKRSVGVVNMAPPTLFPPPPGGADSR